MACGPRTGVHYEKKEEEKPIAICGGVVDSYGKARTGTENGQKLFKQNCAVCHYPHRDDALTGPGLKGVLDRVPSEEWFVHYTLNCDSMKKAGDAYSNKLTAQFNGQEMTVFSGILTEKDVREIIQFLK